MKFYILNLTMKCNVLYKCKTYHYIVQYINEIIEGSSNLKIKISVFVNNNIVYSMIY